MWFVPVRPTVVVLVALVAMTVLRVCHLLELEANSILFSYPMVDALEYFSEAKARADGSYVDSVPMHGPLFPALLGVVYVLCGGDAFWLHLLASLVGQLTVLTIYFGGRRTLGAWPAAFAAAAFALYRPGLLYECEYYAAGLANYFVLLSGLLLVSWTRSGSWRYALGLGVAIGMAVITRTNLVVLVAVAALAVFRSRGSGLQALAIVLLGLFPASLYTVRNYSLSDSFIFVQARGGQNLAMANFEGATGLVDIRPGPEFEAVRRRPMVVAEAFGLAAQDRYHRDRFLEFVFEHPVDFAELLLAKVCNSFSPIEAPSAFDNELNARFSWVLRCPLPGFGWFLPLALVGVLWLRRCGPGLGWLVVLTLAVWSTMILIFPTGRYRYQLAAVYCIFVGFGVWVLLKSLRAPGISGIARLRPWIDLVAGGLLSLIGPRFVTHYDAWRAEFDQLQAYAHYVAGDQDAARRCALAATKADAGYAWPQFMLGVLATHEGELEKAVEFYSRAIKLLPNFPEALENRAAINLQLSRREQALRGFQRVVKLMPFRHQSWRMLGQIYAAKGLTAEARRCEEEADAAIERLRTMPWAR